MLMKIQQRLPNNLKILFNNIEDKMKSQDALLNNFKKELVGQTSHLRLMKKQLIPMNILRIIEFNLEEILFMLISEM